MKKRTAHSQIRQHLFDLLFLIKDRMKAVVKDADSNLTPLQVLVLRTLADEGEMPQNELGNVLAKNKSQITRLVHDLEKKKLVARKRSATDRRSFVLTTPNEVRDKISYFALEEKSIVSTMLEGISRDELKTLERILALMKDNLLEMAGGKNTD